jgi:lipoprotein-releasing system permease protein
MPWYLYLALRQLFPAGKPLGSSFFLLGVLGVALGVAVLVVVQSVMGGFGMVHRERIIDVSGHLDIHAGGRPFAGASAQAARIRERPGVEAVTPYAQGFVMARSFDQPVFPAVLGIDLDNMPPVFAVHRHLLTGTLDDLDDDRVLLSLQVARALGVGMGGTIEVYSPLLIERLKADELFLPREFTVAGVYDLEWNQEFSPGMVLTLRAMQDLYGLDGRVHGMAVRLLPGVDEFAFARALAPELPFMLQPLTWKERWADFLWVLDLEKTMMLFLNLFIVAVAVFAIAVAQLLTVLRKTREIGLLGVIGARSWEVPALYCFQGFFIGLVGLAAGIGIALALLAVRDPIITLIAELSGTRETLLRFYYFANLPVRYSTSDFAVISVCAVLLSTLASLLPALRAARLKPADCLRIEQ